MMAYDLVLRGIEDMLLTPWPAKSSAIVSELMRLHVAKETYLSALHAVAGCSEESVET
jgi:hypothetical protein